MFNILAVTADASFISTQSDKTLSEARREAESWLQDPWYNRRGIIRVFIHNADSPKVVAREYRVVDGARLVAVTK